MRVAARAGAGARHSRRLADEWYKEGETQYNLGNFDKAVDAFKQGFALETDDSKKAAYLYNVAQSYRQAKDCSNAQFFYKRFLSLKDSDTAKPLNPDKRAEIEDRIKELEECARQQEAIKKKPPDQNLKPDDAGRTRPANGTRHQARSRRPARARTSRSKDRRRPSERDDEDDGEACTSRDAAPPKLISARLVGGGAKITTGDARRAGPGDVRAARAAIRSRSTTSSSSTLGAGFTFTPVPFENMATSASKTAQLIGVMANVGATYEVIPKLGLRGDLGLGALFFSGVSESPFTERRRPTTGALTMFHAPRRRCPRTTRSRRTSSRR